MTNDEMNHQDGEMNHQNNEDEKGASMVEYALLVALIAIVAIAAITLLGQAVSEKFSEVTSALDT